MSPNNIFSGRAKLTIVPNIFQRVQALPPIADASSEIVYVLGDADGVVQRAALRDVEEMGAFFGVTVADLGDGHRGYAGSGYNGLGSGYAVNAGGMSGYSAVGAISEQFRAIPSATFTRVGTFTLPTTTFGLGGHNGNLYRVVDTGDHTQIVGFNPETGAVVSTSANATPTENKPEGLTILNGVAYVYGDQTNFFYSYNIGTQTWTRFSTSENLSVVFGLANDGTNVYVLFRRRNRQQYFVAQINQSDGSLSNEQGLTGYESNDAEDTTEGFMGVGDKIYVSTTSANPHIYEVDPSSGQLTVVGDISPDNADLFDLGHLGDYIYARNTQDNGLYRAPAAQGNRWVVIFPTTTTEVDASETTVRLRTEPGGAQIELTKDEGITSALVFASGYDGAAAHTINVGDTPQWALYNGSNVQLFSGGADPAYSDFVLVKPSMGM